DVLHDALEIADGRAVYAAILASRYLNLIAEITSYDYRTLVLGRRTDPPHPGELIFPALTFITFRNSGELRALRPLLNRAHPFSRWLLERSPILARRYPNVLEQIRENLLIDYKGTEPRRYLEPLCDALNRLARLDAELAPPIDAIPKAVDFPNS